MAIRRYENIAINNLTFTQNGFGEQSTTQTKWFDTRALVGDVANSLKISDKYRLYQDMVNFTLNYTPNIKLMVDSQNLYSINFLLLSLSSVYIFNVPVINKSLSMPNQIMTIFGKILKYYH